MPPEHILCFFFLSTAQSACSVRMNHQIINTKGLISVHYSQRKAGFEPWYTSELWFTEIIKTFRDTWRQPECFHLCIHGMSPKRALASRGSFSSCKQPPSLAVSPWPWSSWALVKRQRSPLRCSLFTPLSGQINTFLKIPIPLWIKGADLFGHIFIWQTLLKVQCVWDSVLGVEGRGADQTRCSHNLYWRWKVRGRTSLCT